MPIKFQCAHCGAPIKAPDTHAGETLPCPKCGEPVLVMAAPARTARSGASPEAIGSDEVMQRAP
jgi:DNA-directed RNA polymerase subunit RPC12/RpoP